METLYNKLKTETQTLLEQYIEKTKSYCVNRFKQMEEMNKWTYEKWVEVHGITFTIGGKQQRTLSKSGHRLRNESYSVVSKGFDKFQEREIKKANLHYEGSLLKLVDRLVKKGVTDNFELINSSLGVNFEILIKHPDGKFTRAWTIIAEGEIQRPHYRFLVK